MADDSRIRRSLFGFGSYYVVYRCRKCSVKLTSPLDEAGTADVCPACGEAFMVPGAVERDRLHKESIAKEKVKRILVDGKWRPRNTLATCKANPIDSTDRSTPELPKSVSPPFSASLWTLVAIVTIMITAAVAFEIGRKRAIKPKDDTALVAKFSEPPTTREPHRTPATTQRSEQETEQATLPTIAKKNVTESLEQSDSTPNERTNEQSPFDFATETKRRISDAEKSVGLIEVSSKRRIIELSDRSNTSAASCFIVGPRIIVTNYHVVEGARVVRISFSDGRATLARGWLAIDAEKDLALIECDSGSLPPLKLATSRPSKLDTVFAIGSPLELSGTISTGIVSAIRTEQELGKDVTLIQTTAAISPGNSGGPLLNERGEVVGVTFAFVEGGQNLNFAIASEHLSELLNAAPKESKPWQLLPAPRSSGRTDKSAENLQNDQNQIRKWIEKHLQAQMEDQKNRLEAEKKEGELNRIIARAGQLTQAITALEMEGTTLTLHRDQLWSQVQVALRAARQVELIALSAEASGRPYVAWSISRQAYVNLTPHSDELLQQAARARREADIARNSAEALYQQYVAVCQQIIIKTQQRNALVNELNALRAKYDYLQAE
jgi:S1-C subfamily serine protease/DNA-directed RNA polymerase subunit RPC12/RpoP